MTMFRPSTTCIIAIDTISIGMLNFSAMNPVSIHTTTHKSTAMIIASHIGSPAWYNSAQATPAKAYTLPTEKSRLPVSIRKDTPSATMPVVATWRMIVRMLSTVKNRSDSSTANRMTMITNRIWATNFLDRSATFFTKPLISHSPLISRRTPGPAGRSCQICLRSALRPACPQRSPGSGPTCRSAPQSPRTP